MRGAQTSGLPRRLAVGVGATAAGLTALGTATLAYGVTVERNAFVLRRATRALLPAGSRPLRLLHLSDLHLDPSREVLVSWVHNLVRLEPDLVVATGDFFTSPSAIATVVRALSPFADRPSLFVPGNADYFAPTPKSPTRYITRRPKHGTPLPWPELAAALTTVGWIDLTHLRRTIEVAGGAVEVRGVDDPYLRKDRYQRVSGAPDPAAGISVGLLHAPEPRLLDAMTEDGLDLLLAGHTHGGQIRIPGYGAVVTNCGIDRARARGLSTWSSGGRTATLNVSGGLGTSPYFPLRICCRPEATLLTLTARAPVGGRGTRRGRRRERLS